MSVGDRSVRIVRMPQRSDGAAVAHVPPIEGT
jgi:hypothetical protein